MAVTPAGAEAQQAVATNWRKIWKQELQPKADRRYYTKTKSDRRYERLGSGYTKAESDARYAKDVRTVTGLYAVTGYALPSGCVPHASRLGLYVLVPAQGPGPVQASGSWALGLPAGT